MNRKDQLIDEILYTSLEEANTIEDTKINKLALFATLAAYRAYAAGYDSACRTLRRRHRKKQCKR